MKLVRSAAAITSICLVLAVTSCAFDGPSLPNPLSSGFIADPVVRAYITEALDFLGEEGYFVDEHWNDQVAHTLRSTAVATQVSETYGPLALAVRAAGGIHSGLIRPDGGANNLGSALTLPSSELVAPGVGLLVLPTFDTSDPILMTEYADAAVDAQTALQAEANCGWIIDLYDNQGGSVYPMLAGAAALLPPNETILSFQDRDGARSNVSVSTDGAAIDRETIVATTAKMEPVEKPVAILQSSATASAAEAVLIAFRGQTNARTFGSPSAGYPTGNVTHTLPDNAVLILTNSVEADRNGNIVRGPLSPDTFADDHPSSELEAAYWLASVC